MVREEGASKFYGQWTAYLCLVARFGFVLEAGGFNIQQQLLHMIILCLLLPCLSLLFSPEEVKLVNRRERNYQCHLPSDWSRFFWLILTFKDSTQSTEVHLIRAVENDHVLAERLAHVLHRFWCNKKIVKKDCKLKWDQYKQRYCCRVSFHYNPQRLGHAHSWFI